MVPDKELTDLIQEESLSLGEEELDIGSLALQEEVVSLKRVAKVVKGGRRFSFSALVVVGDEKGHVGIGFGKANEVPEAIGKAIEDGKKSIVSVPIAGRTIPHQVIGKYGAARVLLRPAAEGTGLIAGAAVRAVVRLAGIKDVLTKCHGTNNMINVVKATMQGLQSLQSPERVAQLRGKSLEDVMGKPAAVRYREMRLQAEKKAEQERLEAETPPPAEEAEAPLGTAEEAPPVPEPKKPEAPADSQVLVSGEEKPQGEPIDPPPPAEDKNQKSSSQTTEPGQQGPA